MGAVGRVAAEAGSAAEVARKYTCVLLTLALCPSYYDPIRRKRRGSTLCQYGWLGIYSLIPCKFSPRWYQRDAVAVMAG